MAQKRRMGDESDERANGFLPEGVCEVTKEELNKYIKCKRIGNYLLGKTIGEGSFARVKQGFHVLTGEKVAVKIIDKKRAHQDKYVARNMRREAKIMQMIRHPNIVQLLEVVETEHRYYLITELAAGGDLMDYICYRKKLGEVEVRKFIRQTVSAVHYLHQGGILHRDLKVENLLLDDDYNIKIIDFGLSNTVLAPSSDDSHTTREFLKTQCGSPAYAAPEILGHKPYGPEVDVWSIGVNMYAMLTGKLPYTAEPFHITTLYNKMKNNDMNPLPEHLSAACKDLIRRFLTFNREQRLTLEEALGHAWLRKGYDGPVVPVHFPNYPRDEEIDKNILQYMIDKMEFDRQDVVDAVRQNRSTCSATVYHLLKRKLKKYNNKHPGKARRSSKESVESVKTCRESAQEIRSKTESIKRNEFAVATAEVCDFNEKENTAQKEDHDEVNDSDSSKLHVPSCRTRLSSHSQEKLSSLNGELSTDVGGFDDGKDGEKLKDEQEHAEIDETCNVLSNAGIEISRKNSLNYSSVEVMAVKGRRLSMNLSHISVESKATKDQETLKNTPAEDIAELGDKERKDAVENTKESPRPCENSPSLSQDKTSKSPRHSVPTTPSIGKVSLINAKIISIPLPQAKEDSADKVKVNKRRFSFPQSYVPSKNLGINHQKHPTTGPFGFTSTLPSTENKSRGRNTPILPPYGLCCQLTAIKAQDEVQSAVTGGKEHKPLHEHVTHCNGLDQKHVQLRRSVYCPSPYNDKEQNRWKRHSIATSGGKELLKSINNTLGKLLEVQENTEPVKTLSQECLLLRSRGSPVIRNETLKMEPIIKDLKLSLLQENASVDRGKERRIQGIKLRGSVEDNQSHNLQLLSNLNADSHSMKEQVTREKPCTLGILERTEKRRRRTTTTTTIQAGKGVNEAISKPDGKTSLRR